MRRSLAAAFRAGGGVGERGVGGTREQRREHDDREPRHARHAGTRRHHARTCQGRPAPLSRFLLTDFRRAWSAPRMRHLLATLACVVLATTAAAADRCREGASALSDAKAIAAVRGAIARQCPCASFDGCQLEHEARGLRALRDGRHRQRDRRHAAAGRVHAAPRVPARGEEASTARRRAAIRRRRRVSCAARRSRRAARRRVRRKKISRVRRFGQRQGRPARVLRLAVRGRRLQLRRDQRVHDARSCRRRSTSRARRSPPRRPGSPGVVVTNPEAAGAVRRRPLQPEQRALHAPSPGRRRRAARRDPDPGPRLRGRRRRLQDPGREPHPARAGATGSMLEVWAFDRRTNQLEDLVGARHRRGVREPARSRSTGSSAASSASPLHPAAGARARTGAPVFYDTQADVPFIANWTNLVFSRDIDAVVDGARGRGA